MSHRHGHHNHGKRNLFSDLGNLFGFGTATEGDSQTKFGFGAPVTSEPEPAAAPSVQTTTVAGVLPPVQVTRTSSTEQETTHRTTEVTEPTATKTEHSSSITEAHSTNDLTSIIQPSTTITSAPSAILTAAASSVPVISSSLSSSVSNSVGLDQTASPSPSAASATPSVQQSSSGGLSAGAKAGIAIGVLAGIGLLASMILFWLHKKRQHEESLAEEDNEKSLPSIPPSTSNPPPLTQPRPAPLPQSSGRNPLAAAALGVGAGAAAGEAARNLTGNGVVERPYNGRAHAPPQSPSVQQNPFKDPENPFASPADVVPDNRAPNTTSPVRDLTLPPVSPVSPVSLSGPQLGARGAGEAAGLAAGVAGGAAAMAASKTANHSTQQRTPSPEYREASGSPEFGGAGSRPQSPAGAPSNVHRVQMDYIPTMNDEIELRAGQLVRLLHAYDDGWTNCATMDGSRKGIAPRSCLSSRPLQPRNGPGSPGFGPNGRPMSPAGARRGPGPGGPPRFYQDGRPMSPGLPGPHRPQQGRPMSPAGRPPYSDTPRPLTPGGSRPAGMPTPPGPSAQRNRNDSGAAGRPNGPPAEIPPNGPRVGSLPQGQGPIERKPVGGQA